MGNCCYRNKLENQTKELPFYKLNGKFKCKVVDVYDGNYVTIVIKNRGTYEKYEIQMYGYECYSLDLPKCTKYRDEKIKKAKSAKIFLSNLVLNKICYFEVTGQNKNGLTIGKLYLRKFKMQSAYVNNLMIETYDNERLCQISDKQINLICISVKP